MKGNAYKARQQNACFQHKRDPRKAGLMGGGGASQTLWNEQLLTGCNCEVGQTIELDDGLLRRSKHLRDVS